MNPGIDNKPFEIVLGKKSLLDPVEIEVISEPVKTHWIYDILYYLSLGLYDRRGYIYKVKMIKNK